MIYELNHLGVVVSDVDASLAFYRDRLGGSIVFDRRSSIGARIVYLRVGSGLVELIAPDQVDEAVAARPRHLGFLTDDLDGDFERLVSHGAEPMWRPAVAGTGVGRTAQVLDPAGTKVELIQRDVDFRADASAIPLDRLGFILRSSSAPQLRNFYSDVVGLVRQTEEKYVLGGDSLVIEQDDSEASVLGLSLKREQAHDPEDVDDGSAQLSAPDATLVRMA